MTTRTWQKHRRRSLSQSLNRAEFACLWHLAGLFVCVVLALLDSSLASLPASEKTWKDPTIEILPDNSSLIFEGKWLVYIAAPHWDVFSREFQDEIWEDVVKDLVLGRDLLPVNGTNGTNSTPENAKTSSGKTAEATNAAATTETFSQTLQFGFISPSTNLDLTALLEPKSYPTVKLLLDGHAWTFSNRSLDRESIVRFAREGWRELGWFNKVPKKNGWGVKWQLELWEKWALTMSQIDTSHYLTSTTPTSQLNLVLFSFLLLLFFIVSWYYSPYHLLFSKARLLETWVFEMIGFGDFDEEEEELLMEQEEREREANAAREREGLLPQVNVGEPLDAGEMLQEIEDLVGRDGEEEWVDTDNDDEEEVEVEVQVEEVRGARRRRFERDLADDID